MRFCGNCGAKLPPADQAPAPQAPAQQAPARVGELPIGPEQLGVLTGSDLLERFRQAGLEAAGQRRSVTVLFVDLSGFTQLSEELGDEQLFELVQKYIAVLIGCVYRYEGMVDKLTGDGLMALFGAPIAHENNAERALRSALEMVAAVDGLSRELKLGIQPLRIHVGLNAGSVIVGGVGGDGLMNYTAIGDSVNLARRLEEAAESGSILVSQSVFRQTSRLFDFDALPPLALKNVSQPVTAYRARGLKDHPEPQRGLEGLHAPMIGRENELRQAQAMVERLVTQRKGGLALVAGEGGLGKSRLTSELKSGLNPNQLTVLEGHSLTYRKSIAYWIFQEILRDLLGVRPDTPEMKVRERLVLVSVRALGDRASEKIPYLEHLLSIEHADPEDAVRIRYLDAGQLRQQIFMAARDLLVAEARRKPLLLILEDLHWADDASLDLLRFMIDSTRSAPLLIYAISRPFEGGSLQAVHDHALRRLASGYLYLRLQALQPEQTAQLLQALLSIQDLPEALREQIIQRSAGLPFYLEEILRMLIENNVIYQDTSNGSAQWRLAPGAELEAIGVPDTLQGLILARFDRLTPLQRRVLQTASVVGYQFSEAVLSRILLSQSTLLGSDLSQALAYLTAHEFIQEFSPDPAGGNVYVFKHVLVSDAVYGTLLQRDRRDLHTRAGQAMETIYAGRLEGQIEVLAGHFLRSPLLDRALHYLILAGQKAARSYANEQARQYFNQALDVLPKVAHTSEQAVQVYQGTGDLLLISGDYPAAREQFLRGLEALGAQMGTNSLAGASRRNPQARSERRLLLSQLQCRLARTHESQGDYETASLCLRAAQKLLTGDERGFTAEQANILSDLGWIDFRRGGLDQAETALRQALVLAEAAGKPDVLASVLNRLAGIYFQRDNPDQASRYLLRALGLREKIGDVVAVARSYNNLGLLRWKQGDLKAALDHFNHSLTLHANLGDVEGLISLQMNMGLIELDLGGLDAADRHFQEALQSASQVGHFFHVCEARMHLALLNVHAGEWRKVIEEGQQGLEGFQELGVKENQLDLNVSLGWAYLGLGETEHLDEVLRRIDALVQERGGDAPSEGEGRALRLLGCISFQRGDLQAARQELEKSAAIFDRLGSAIERGRALVDLAGVLSACGERETALALLAEAGETFRRMGARLELERLEKLQKG